MGENKSTKNKIVFVSNFLGNGGAARVISVLADGFVEKGLDVTIISYKGTAAAYPRNERINYVDLEPKGKGVFYKISRIRQLRKALKKFKGATVIAFEDFVAMQTIVASRGLKQRLIISERNDPSLKNGRKFFCWMRKKLYKKAHVSVFQTPDARNCFEGKIKENGVVIANPIIKNLPDYVGENSKNIINFCRLEKQKNLPMLIDAFRKLLEDYPDFNLHIYGDGQEKENIENYVREKGMDEKIKLFPSTNDIHKIASQYKMFACSSDHEGISNSMLEAMGIGLPVVCTDCPCGGARMVINDGVNGLLTPVGDSNAMYLAMKKILDDKTLANTLSENAKKVRDEYSRERIVEKWYELL